MPKKSVFDLNENVAGALCYSLLFFSGIFFLIADRENKFVRFHALQSTILFLALAVLSAVTSWIPIVRLLIPGLLSLVTFVCWVFLMFTAFKGQTFKIPILGEVVWDKTNS